uniref:Uncharacterized protein n=1 Tax=Pipistrellus kuhlii TaxID=59472 RepID=A0A7J7TP15_PIPKU|nr:hypothetical protein mPipKuh1_009291 [Pipistrellus kuhlii]
MVSTQDTKPHSGHNLPSTQRKASPGPGEMDGGLKGGERAQALASHAACPPAPSNGPARLQPHLGHRTPPGPQLRAALPAGFLPAPLTKAPSQARSGTWEEFSGRKALSESVAGIVNPPAVPVEWPKGCEPEALGCGRGGEGKGHQGRQVGPGPLGRGPSTTHSQAQ